MTNIIFNIVFGIVGYLFFGMLYVKLMHKLMQTKNPTIVNMVDGFFVRNFEEEKLQEMDNFYNIITWPFWVIMWVVSFIIFSGYHLIIFVYKFCFVTNKRNKK